MTGDAGDAGAAAVERAAEVLAGFDGVDRLDDGVWSMAYRARAQALAAANLLAAPVPTGTAHEIEAALSKVDRTWGGAAMVVKDTVLSILGRRCTNEFCEHDHAAMRDLRSTGTAHEEPLREAIEALILELNADADYRVPKRIVGDRLRAVLASHDTGSGQ